MCNTTHSETTGITLSLDLQVTSCANECVRQRVYEYGYVII